MKVVGSVPVPLIQHAIQNSYWQPFRTFLFLKYKFDKVGYFRLDKFNVEQLTKATGLKERTVFNHVKKLTQLNLLGKGGSGCYHIRGYNWLRSKFKLPRGRKVELESKDLKRENFEAYLFGSVVGYLILKRKFDERRAELQKGGLDHVRRDSKIYKCEQGIALSCRFLAIMIGVSRSRINRMLKSAVKHKYLFMHRNIQILPLPLIELEDMIEDWEEGKPRPILFRGCVALQHPNSYEALLTFKRVNR